MTVRKHFKNRNTLLHFVASTDYENDVIYYTDSGKTWFCNDRLYRNNNCIGYVNRETEQVFRNVSLGENTSMWQYMRELFDAFKHYEPIDLTSFNDIDAYRILDKSFLSIRSLKNPTYMHHKAYVLAYMTVMILSTGSDLIEEHRDQYKKSLKFVKDQDKKNEKERKEHEKAQKAFDKECFKISKKFFKDLLIGKDWNEKLKNYCRKTRKVDITVEEWKELARFFQSYEKFGLYCLLFSISSPPYALVNGEWERISEYPEHPCISFSSRIINRYKGLPNNADFLYLDDDMIKTTRGVSVDDSKCLVRNLLKKFIKSSDEDRQKFIGLHVGSFVIREWNPEQRYLQIGCHRFYEKTLEEFADYICSIQQA